MMPKFKFIVSTIISARLSTPISSRIRFRFSLITTRSVRRVDISAAYFCSAWRRQPYFDCRYRLKRQAAGFTRLIIVSRHRMVVSFSICSLSSAHHVGVSVFVVEEGRSNGHRLEHGRLQQAKLVLATQSPKEGNLLAVLDAPTGVVGAEVEALGAGHRHGHHFQERSSANCARSKGLSSRVWGRGGGGGGGGGIKDGALVRVDIFGLTSTEMRGILLRLISISRRVLSREVEVDEEEHSDRRRPDRSDKKAGR
ncbi:hypothetical protein TYRP_021211 [Tyrophagus putrescentiae]|nr:hypothetical protein TYRP_021211 [Tyrophagus putrescentiae]